MIDSESCGIDLGNKYVVIGGKGAEKKVIQYRKNGFDHVLPDLIVGRYGHACAKFENADGKKVFMVTGGWITHKRSIQTEMMTDNKNWKIITSAWLPVPLVDSAAITVNNKVYLFGNFS